MKSASLADVFLAMILISSLPGKFYPKISVDLISLIFCKPEAIIIQFSLFMTTEYFGAIRGL